MDSIVYVILAVVLIAVTTSVAPKLNIAGPLILVLVGIGVGLLPFVPAIEVEPEIILVGVLPPLLYSAAVALPAVEFRRDFGPIAGLSVLLVVLSSAALAVFFLATIPGLSPYLAIGLGAILSPTDAVATSIVRRLGISRRVVTMLEGESLLNDATALVLLRTMVAAAAVGVAGTASEDGVELGFIPAFLWGVLVAVVIGAIVGYVNLRVRALFSHSAANTAIGFVVPFVAFLPTERLGGSGLVAAVVAGIVTGQGAARWFTPGAAPVGRAQLADDRARARRRRLPADGPRAQGDRRPEPRGARRSRHRHPPRPRCARDHPRACAPRTSRCWSGCRAGARAASSASASS